MHSRGDAACYGHRIKTSTPRHGAIFLGPSLLPPFDNDSGFDFQVFPPRAGDPSRLPPGSSNSHTLSCRCLEGISPQQQLRPTVMTMTAATTYRVPPLCQAPSPGFPMGLLLSPQPASDYPVLHRGGSQCPRVISLNGKLGTHATLPCGSLVGWIIIARAPSVFPARPSPQGQELYRYLFY